MQERNSEYLDLPEMEQARQRLQEIPWCKEGETSSTKELNFVLLCKVSLRLNKLKCCYRIPCRAASSLPMLTAKTLCTKELLLAN